MTDKNVISYDEYQKLSDEEKQNFEPHWHSDGKSGIATRKGAKLPEVKSKIPVTGMKAAEPDKTKNVLSKEEAAKAGIKTGELPTQFDLEHPTLSGSNRNVSDENGWIDNDGNVHLNSRANEAYNKAVESDRTADKTNQMSDSSKAKTDTTDKANQIRNSLKVKINRIRNYLKDKTDQLSDSSTDKTDQMSDSSETKTDTTATDKSINPFQAGKEVADKAVEDANILLDRVKQLTAKVDSISSKDWNTFSPIDPDFDKELLELERETEALAKEFGIDIGNLSVMKTVGNKTPSRFSQIKRLKKINEELVDAAEERSAAAKTIQQEAQTNYTKAEEEEAAKRKVESKPAPKAQKVAESTRNKLTEVTTKEQKAQTEKDETKTEKDETKDPLEKAEELEQPRAPTDIKRFSNDLNRFVIQAYLNGDFGKKSSPNAIATMGYFILDKLGTALVNASQVARGLNPSAKSQWSKVLDKQTELLGNRITAEWLLSLPKETQIALYRIGYFPGISSQSAYENTDENAIIRAAQRDALGVSKLSQEQKGIAQSNVNALLARKSELQTLINQLKSDQGWDVYTQAMNAVVGTAKGLNSLGITDNSSSSSNKGFSDTLSADVKTGKLPSAFVSGGISNESSWNNSSAEALSKSNSLSQDALALSKFETGEDYAKATREAKKAANEQLIKRLEEQIEIIDKCIDSWGKDLGL